VIALDRFYDAINTAIFLPAGGSRRLRQELVGQLGVRPGDRVLDLGCGTGQVTERLLAAGTDVVAVDALPAMLVGARRRAPRASFVEGDAFDVDVGDGFDRVVLSFVLHNFDTDDRRRLLARARSALGDDGRIGVLEWAVPRGRWRAACWRWFLHRLEPSPAVAQLLDGALDTDISVAGLAVDDRRAVAGGCAQILALRPTHARAESATARS
jgi:ubiquinone/menaquinone biosynthesis C-methylase UbiE